MAASVERHSGRASQHAGAFPSRGFARSRSTNALDQTLNPKPRHHRACATRGPIRRSSLRVNWSRFPAQRDARQAPLRAAAPVQDVHPPAQARAMARPRRPLRGPRVAPLAPEEVAVQGHWMGRRRAPRARVRHGGGDRVHRQDARRHVHELLARHQRNHRGRLRLRALPRPPR